ncbi:bacteriohemerythrin [candidate division KSB1 bacterium]
MVTIKWTDDLATGIVWVDNQHKQLIQHVIKFIKAMQEKKASGEITSTLNFMEEYIAYHFDTEEKYMVEFSYPGYEEHRMEHEILSGNIHVLRAALSRHGISAKLEELVRDQLVNWYVDHIGNWDKDFARFLKSKGKSQV